MLRLRISSLNIVPKFPPLNATHEAESGLLTRLTTAEEFLFLLNRHKQKRETSRLPFFICKNAFIVFLESNERIL